MHALTLNRSSELLEIKWISSKDCEVLHKPANDALIWIRCAEAGKHLKPAGQRPSRTDFGHPCSRWSLWGIYLLLNHSFAWETSSIVSSIMVHILPVSYSCCWRTPLEGTPDGSDQEKPAFCTIPVPSSSLDVYFQHGSDLFQPVNLWTFSTSFS